VWDWPNDLSLLLFCSHSQLPLIYKSLNHPFSLSAWGSLLQRERTASNRYPLPISLSTPLSSYISFFLIPLSSHSIICRVFHHLLPTRSIWSMFFARDLARQAESLSNALLGLSRWATESAPAEPIGRAPAPS